MTFLHPLLLLALLVLPLAFWVTRMTPPPAKQYIFPPLKILQSIQIRRSTPARASIWLFILRFAALALIILGLAHPIWSPKMVQDGWRNNDITIIIDNGWAAYPNRSLIRETILRLGKNSFAHGHAVTLVATARQDDGSFTGPMVSHDLSLLREHLQRVRPHPWTTERAKALKDVALGGRTLLLLSDGVATDEDASFRKQLQAASRRFTLALPDRDILTLNKVSEGNSPARFMISRLGTAPTEFEIVAETAGLSLSGVIILPWPQARKASNGRATSRRPYSGKWRACRSTFLTGIRLAPPVSFC
ncbi:MAG: BatA domain-containing protein [Acetobacteraceae bacterium]